MVSLRLWLVSRRGRGEGGGPGRVQRVRWTCTPGGQFEGPLKWVLMLVSLYGRTPGSFATRPGALSVVKVECG